MSIESARRAQSIRDNSEHPDFFRGESDANLDRAIDDAVEDGDAMLKFAPGLLLGALAQLCNDADFNDAARELLRPIYSAAQGLLMGEFHAATKDHYAVREVARVALELDRKHMRGN